ncbi:MAG TPA: hypothetical protein VGI21_18710 [Streptosporangiaceae bacterium]
MGVWPTADSPGDAAMLARGFERADQRYGPVPIWWWSGERLNRARLRWQMEQLCAQGVTQAVVMCLAPRGPLYGSLADDPPFLSEAWWDIFLAACADAQQLGFHFWLYDQFGFSGANFQGQLTTAHPEWTGQELVRADDGTCHAESRGFDYYDPAACRALIDTVLGEFRRRAGEWFGSVITGLFQDELPHLPSWGKDFAASFTREYGYDLRDQLPLLWDGDSDQARRVRRDYHAHRAELAARAFFAPYADWANAAGLIAGFDQQSPAREGDPAGSVELYGDYLATHRRFTAPGSDHWGDPKLHSSLAHAGGHPRTWIEAFHSSGWGGTLEETYDWLGPFLRRGATLYDPHAVYYSTVGGWWEWAPPSTCWRQPYWPDYHVFSGAVTRLCQLLSAGQLVADTVLLYPTQTAQADVTLAGPRAGAQVASGLYNELNGSTAWFDERPGILDRARTDYEIFDEPTLTAGQLDGDTWRVAGGTFRNIILPGVTMLGGRLAGQLAAFAAAGGTVVAAGTVPHLFSGPDHDGGAAFTRAVANGLITVADSAAAVVPRLRRGPVAVEADVPYLLRRVGDALVLLLVAHDGQTGTSIPLVPGHSHEDRIAGRFTWRGYWEGRANEGYQFIPVGDRVAHVTVAGAPGAQAQRWDPRSGARTGLAIGEGPGGELTLAVPFEDGPMSVVVLSAGLPPATRPARGDLVARHELDGHWEIEARSTLDNQWGDLGDARVTGTLPIEVWPVEHAEGTPAQGGPAGTEPPSAASWHPALATFGPYVQVWGPQGTCAGPAGPDAPGWRDGEFSLSRGIRKDPIHFDNLGPKGSVPEEFLLWPDVGPGEWVAVRCLLDLPAGGERVLVVGTDADRRVFLDGRPVVVNGSGYWTQSPVTPEAGPVEAEIWLSRPADDGPGPAALRASFAVVADPVRYQRPEWLEPADGARASTTVRFTTAFTLSAVPPQAQVQVATVGPATIGVNGQEIGRQGAFEPYAKRRRATVQPYELTGALTPGRNELTLEIQDLGDGVAALADSVAAGHGGIGVLTDLTWAATRDGVAIPLRLRREQWSDPRWVCLRARPHPLPRSAWLNQDAASDGVVLDLVPSTDADPGAAPRVEWLRFTAPVGAISLRVPTEVPFTAIVDGRPIPPDGDVITLDKPLAAGTVVYLRFDAASGHRGGGLLSGPVQARTVSTDGELAEWGRFGLGSFGGSVSYRRTIHAEASGPGDSVLLDLGEVRGSAEVLINQMPAATLTWSPYQADITAYLRPGANDLEVIVRGTLAGYLGSASPTPAVTRGQDRHGLFGPAAILMLHSHP